MLSWRHLPLVAAVLAAGLVLPTLGNGWIHEDHLHRLQMTDPGRFRDVVKPPMDLFRWYDGDPERTGRLMDLGLAPWWTFRGIRHAFWRPLAVLTHRLDYCLWPDDAVPMHAQSILWLGMLVLATGVLYRRFMGVAWPAGLAAVLFALDDAHALPVGFLASRNALMAAFFGVCAVLAHDRWRRRGRRTAAVAGSALFVLSLLSSEAGIATCAYLAAYAVFIESGSRRRRLLSLVPYGLIVLVWRVVWVLMGYGVSDVGLYVDPLGDPLRYAGAVLSRGPLLLLGQWVMAPSELGLILGPDGRLWHWVASVVFLLVLAVGLWPLVRHDRTARFWALGMVLSVLPVCATFPMDRLLLFVGVGGMALVAQFLAAALGRPAWRLREKGTRTLLCEAPFGPTGKRVLVPFSPAAWLLGPVFILSHVLMAPVVLPFRAVSPLGPEAVVGGSAVAGLTGGDIEHQQVILVNAPSAFNVMYMPVCRALDNQPVPGHVRVLTPALCSSVVRRSDAGTLVVCPQGGYLVWTMDRLFRDERRPMSLGEKVRLTGLTVEVTALTPDGRPAEATFRFDVPLEDPSLRWLAWERGGFRAFRVPAVGESVGLRSVEDRWLPLVVLDAHHR